MKVVVDYELLNKEKAVYLNRLVDMYVQTIKDFKLGSIFIDEEIFNEYGYFELNVFKEEDVFIIMFKELEK